jgi:homotetrameric cytidine deaminase
MRPPTDAERQLHARAEEARANAYVPYSGFAVGAALAFEDGAVVTAANVENASYGLTICAERSAMVAAVAQGHRKLVAVAVAGPAEDVSPCGACRQVLAEFGDGDTPVTFPYGGALVTAALAELLPAGFML